MAPPNRHKPLACAQVGSALRGLRSEKRSSRIKDKINNLSLATATQSSHVEIPISNNLFHAVCNCFGASQTLHAACTVLNSVLSIGHYHVSSRRHELGNNFGQLPTKAKVSFTQINSCLLPIASAFEEGDQVTAGLGSFSFGCGSSLCKESCSKFRQGCLWLRTSFGNFVAPAISVGVLGSAPC